MNVPRFLCQRIKDTLVAVCIFLVSLVIGFQSTTVFLSRLDADGDTKLKTIRFGNLFSCQVPISHETERPCTAQLAGLLKLNRQTCEFNDSTISPQAILGSLNDGETVFEKTADDENNFSSFFGMQHQDSFYEIQYNQDGHVLNVEKVRKIHEDDADRFVKRRLVGDSHAALANLNKLERERDGVVGRQNFLESQLGIWFDDIQTAQKQAKNGKIIPLKDLHSELNDLQCSLDSIDCEIRELQTYVEGEPSDTWLYNKKGKERREREEREREKRQREREEREREKRQREREERRTERVAVGPLPLDSHTALAILDNLLREREGVVMRQNVLVPELDIWFDDIQTAQKQAKNGKIIPLKNLHWELIDLQFYLDRIDCEIRKLETYVEGEPSGTRLRNKKRLNQRDRDEIQDAWLNLKKRLNQREREEREKKPRERV